MHYATLLLDDSLQRHVISPHHIILIVSHLSKSLSICIILTNSLFGPHFHLIKFGEEYILGLIRILWLILCIYFIKKIILTYPRRLSLQILCAFPHIKRSLFKVKISLNIEWLTSSVDFATRLIWQVVVLW